MPGPRTHGGRRNAIYAWRVKAGKKDVFEDPVKSKCQQFIRDHDGKFDGVKLQLVAPNY